MEKFKGKGLPNNLKKQVRKMVKNELHQEVEHKYYVAADTGTTADFGGRVDVKTAIPQGDTDVTRDGDSVQLEEIEFRYNVQLADTTNTFRVIIFQWHPNSTPAVANVLLSVGSVNGVNSAFTVDYEQQFKILYDRVHYLNSVAVPQTGIEHAVKIRKGFTKRLQFAAGGVTGTNLLYSLYISDSGAATHPSINAYMRIRFSDA